MNPRALGLDHGSFILQLNRLLLCLLVVCKCRIRPPKMYTQTATTQTENIEHFVWETCRQLIKHCHNFSIILTNKDPTKRFSWNTTSSTLCKNPRTVKTENHILKIRLTAHNYHSAGLNNHRRHQYDRHRCDMTPVTAC